MRHPSDLITRVKKYPVSNFSHFFYSILFSYLASSFGHMQAFFFLFYFCFFSMATHIDNLNFISHIRKPSIKREFMNLTRMSISESVYDTQSDWIHTNKLKLNHENNLSHELLLLLVQ